MQIRLTKAEFAAVCEAANSYGLKTATFVKRVAVRWARACKRVARGG